MKISTKLFYRVLLIIIVLSVSQMLTYSQKSDTLLAHYNVYKCDSLIQANVNNPDFVIMDVRTLGEYNPMHLIGAINRDYYASNFSQLIGALPKHKLYLIHCQSGGRSGLAYNIMLSQGFTKVVNMLGGMNSWYGSFYPTTSLFAPLLMAVSDTMVARDTINIGTVDTIRLIITNRANDILTFNAISSLSGTEFTSDFDTSSVLLGAEDYSFSIFYEPLDVIPDSISFLIESNSGMIAFHIWRSGKLGVGVKEEVSLKDINIFPNPFTALTSVEVKLSGFGYVKLDIFDLSGKVICNLTSGFYPVGTHKFEWNAEGLPAGLYFLRLETNGLKETRKLILLK